MAESAAYARRGIKGACAATTIPAGLNAGATTATLADASTWAGLLTNGNARLMINRTGATPEEIEISGLSGNDITISARGLQGTSDATHAAGVSIEVIHSPRDFNEANLAVVNTIGRVTTAGDLLYATGANVLARLGIGTARQELATNAAGTAPEWAPSARSVLTATGDLLYASAANTLARLAAGTNGHVLTLAAGVPSWAAASGGGTNVLAYDEDGSDQTGIGTSYTATALSQAVTVPTAGVVIHASVRLQKRTSAGTVSARIYDVTGSAQVGIALAATCAIDDSAVIALHWAGSPGAGSRTYRIEALASADTCDFKGGSMVIEGRV